MTALRLALLLALAACGTTPPPPLAREDPELPAPRSAWRAPSATVPAMERAPWKPEAATPPVEPRAAEWESLKDDRDHFLTPPSEEDLRGAAHLERELRALAAWRAPVGGGWWSGRSMAGVAREFEKARADPEATGRLLAELADAAGADRPLVERYLAPLVRTRALWSGRWQPDSPSQEDGILEGATYPQGERRVLQGAVLVFADLGRLEAAMLDYARTPGDAGQKTLDAYPLARTYVRGRHPCGRPFTAWRAFHQTALGFPFGELAYVTVNVNHYDEAGTPLAEAYALPGRFDGKRTFAWLVAREAYLPLDDHGTTVATLVVNSLTLDIAGLWETEGHRRRALRQRLGNLKRAAEAGS